MLKKLLGADQVENGIVLLKAARKQKDTGCITDEQYDELLGEIHSSLSDRDQRKIKKLLDEQYFIADDMVNTFDELMEEISDEGASSLLEYIANFPDDAYINGVINPEDYNYEPNPPLSNEVATHLLSTYIAHISAEKAEILAEIRMLGGDTQAVSAELDKISF